MDSFCPLWVQNELPKIGNASQSTLPEMNFKMFASNCKPGNVAKRIEVPLTGVDKKVVKRRCEEALLRITNHGAGGDTRHFLMQNL